MQAKAYEGYFDNGLFYTAGKPIRLPERRKVYVTVLDIPAQVDNTMDWVNELEHMIKNDTSEPLQIEDFPRVDFTRELPEVLP